MGRGEKFSGESFSPHPHPPPEPRPGHHADPFLEYLLSRAYRLVLSRSVLLAASGLEAPLARKLLERVALYLENPLLLLA